MSISRASGEINVFVPKMFSMKKNVRFINSTIIESHARGPEISNIVGNLAIAMADRIKQTKSRYM